MRTRAFSIVLILLGAPVIAPLSSSLAAQQSYKQRPSTAATDSLPLSLSDAVSRADRVGEEVQVARANLYATGARATVARAAGLPQLRVSASENRTVASARGQAVGAVFNQPYSYAATLNASQSLFQGGRIVNGIRAARAATGASAQDLAEIRSLTSLQTQTAYVNALFTHRLVQIQEGSLELAAAQLKQAEQFEKAGRMSRYDVLRARVALANIEPLVLQAREDAEVASLELKRLANIKPSQPLLLTTSIDSVVIDNVLASVDTAVGPEDRPALASAQFNARAQELGVSIARAAMLPSITFNFNSGYGAYPVNGDIFPPGRGVFREVPCAAGSTPDKVCKAQNGGWFSDRSFGFTVSIPVFDGLLTKGNIDLAGAESRIAKEHLAQTRENVFNDVARAKADLSRARAQYGAQQQNVAEAMEAYQLASLRFSRGMATQLEVSDAQLALTTAQTNQARSLYDVYIAAVSLAQTQGRPLPLPSTDNASNQSTGGANADH
ncbi:MAG: TolC family protein [Gemmatimonadaceae bacterium]